MRALPWLGWALAAGCTLPPFSHTLGGDAGVDQGLEASTDVPAADADLRPPRPLAPLSTSRVTSYTTTLRWDPRGAATVVVEMCRDRACTQPLPGFPRAVAGDRLVPPPLPPGVVFWRLRSQRTGELSPTWQFSAGISSTALDASSGTIPDFNGDGFADLVVGAPSVDGEHGAAYVYYGSARGPADAPDVTLGSFVPEASFFGVQTGSAGDVDGDGYGDLYVSGDERSLRSGRVYVYRGGPDGVSQAPSGVLTVPRSDLIQAGTSDGAWLFGRSVAGVGDTDGDGYGELAVGAQYAFVAGRVYVFRGSASGLVPETPVTLVPPPPESDPSGGFGRVSRGGDIDGDQYADLVVGEPDHNKHAGRAFVYAGSADGLGATPRLSLAAPEGAGSSFGIEASCDGDFDGDGRADVVVAAFTAGRESGSVHLYRGSSWEAMRDQPTVSLTSPGGAGSNFGCAISAAGDVDGDGRAELLVGAHWSGARPGAAYLYPGGDALVSAQPAHTFRDLRPAAGTYFGWHVSGAGDVDRDGFADLLVGAPGPHAGLGRAYFYRGGAGLDGSPSRTLSVARAGETWFGASVAQRGAGGACPRGLWLTSPRAFGEGRADLDHPALPRS